MNKKFLSLPILIFGSLFLAGCGTLPGVNPGTGHTTSTSEVQPSTNDSSNEDENVNAPVYEGMSIGHKNNANLSSRRNSSIKDIVDLDVVTRDDIEYYVDKNEEFNIEVHLFNPHEYEIQSFTLNGVKYANYMFEEGSTLQTLLLKTIAPSESGITEYTIDAIKYIDGERIRDVKMDGEKTIKAGVTYSNKPTVTEINNVILPNSVQFNFDLADVDNRIDDNNVKLYVSDGTKVVHEQQLAKGINNLDLKNLYEDHEYEIGIAATFDILDGKDLHSEWIYLKTIKTPTCFKFYNISAGKRDIKFDIVRTYEIGEISEINLYDDVKNTKLTSIEPDKRVFENLLSNHDYRIEVVYKYMVNDVEEVKTLKTERIKTLPLENGEVNLKITKTTKDSVEYIITKNDKDNVITIKNVEIRTLDSDETYLTNDGTLTNKFENLLSNTSYLVVVNYEYDLNDGSGIHTNMVSTTTETLERKPGEVQLVDVVPGVKDVKFDLEITDTDSTFDFINYELYKDDKVIKTNTELTEKSFQELKANTIYKIRANYKIDLRDGKQATVGYVEQEFLTNIEDIKLTSIEVVDTNYAVLNKDIEVAVNFENPSRVEITNVYINNKVATIKRIQSTRAILSISNDVFEAANKNIKVTGFDYKSNGYNKHVEITSDLSLDLFYLDQVEFLDLTNLDGQHNYQGNIFTLRLTLANPSNYEVESLEFKDEFNQEKVIISKEKLTTTDNKTFEFDYEITDSRIELILTLEKIIYKYNDKLVAAYPEAGRSSLIEIKDVIEVNSVDDFLAMDLISNSYKLMCDIDLTNIDFNGFPLLNTYFDGNNHTIKNWKKNIKPTDIDKNAFFEIQPMFGIFEISRGVIENLNIENITLLTKENLKLGGLVNILEGDLYNVNATDIEITSGHYAGGLVGESLGQNIMKGCSVTNFNGYANSTLGGLTGGVAHHDYLIGNTINNLTGCGDTHQGGLIGDSASDNYVMNNLIKDVAFDTQGTAYTGGICSYVNSDINHIRHNVVANFYIVSINGTYYGFSAIAHVTLAPIKEILIINTTDLDLNYRISDTGNNSDKIYVFDPQNNITYNPHLNFMTKEQVNNPKAYKCLIGLTLDLWDFENVDIMNNVFPTLK